MPANLQPLVDQVNKTKGVMASAKTLIEGFGAKLQAAVDEALANGATGPELQPLTDLIHETGSQADALAAAIAANP